MGLLLTASSGLAAETQPVPAPKTSVLAEAIHDYIVAHPEVILDSVRAFAERNQAAAQKQKQDLVIANLPALHSDSPSIMAATTSGEPVTVVEFFDFRCGYCRKMAGAVSALGKTAGVRIVFKDLPILGPDSMLAAQAALAAEKQNAYEKLHDALFESAAPLTQGEIEKIAAKAGLDIERLKKDMLSQEVKAALNRNAEIADKLGVRSTPTFVVGQQLVAGAIEPQALTALIEKARQEVTSTAPQSAAGDAK